MQINVGNTPGQAAEAVVTVDANGNIIQDVSTYSIAVVDVNPVANATDLLQIIGSATKTICITAIRITADSSAAGEMDFYLFKRSALNTGGTSTHPTPVAYDSNNPAATAVINLYSANPSALGAGSIITASQFIYPVSSSGSGIPMFPIIFQFGSQTDQSITLRGVNQSLSISLNGQTIPSGFSVYITIEWTEQ